MKKALFLLLSLALASVAMAEKLCQAPFTSPSRQPVYPTYTCPYNTREADTSRDTGGFAARSYCGYRLTYKHSHNNWYKPSPYRTERKCSSTLVVPVPLRSYYPDHDYITVYTPRVRRYPNRIEGEIFSYNQGYIFYTYYPKEDVMTIWDTGRNDYFTIFLDYEDR